MSALISLLILVIVLGVILWLCLYLIDMLPIEPNFKQIAKVLMIVVAILILLMRALPILGVSA